MRQVPEYALIGNGRLAHHFKAYFDALNIPYQHWYRSQNRPLTDAVATCSHVLLLINDDAIEPFYHAHPCLDEKKVIHCSGSRSISGLYAAHPLMTFGPTLYSSECYQKIPFVVETTDLNFQDLFPQLPNPWYAISPHDKKRYHALCVMAGNFSCLLWQKLFSDFEKKLQIPSSAAMPYLEQVTQNLKHKPDQALTGPLVRNDQNTLKQHLEALQDDPFLEVYQAFIQTYQRSGGHI